MIRIKRIYDKPGKGDGCRVLVDRIWPRGVAKEAAAVDLWLKNIAPSAELRKWFGHDPENWDTFKKRYIEELKRGSQLLHLKNILSANKTVTLLYSARDENHNNAKALKAFFS